MLPVTVDTVRVFLHVLAATVWVGGQLTLLALLSLLRQLPDDAAKRAARRFNRVAWPAFGVLVLTGAWGLFRGDVASAPAPYHATLGLKLTLVVLSGVTVAVHVRARSKLWLALGGALGLLCSLGALFVGVLLSR